MSESLATAIDRSARDSGYMPEVRRSRKAITPRLRGRLDYWEKPEEPPCPFSGAADAAEWRRGYLEARKEAEA